MINVKRGGYANDALALGPEAPGSTLFTKQSPNISSRQIVHREPYTQLAVNCLSPLWLLQTIEP